MKKGLFKSVFVLGMFVVFAGFFVKPVHVQAAAEYKSYNLYSADKKCGKYYFRLEKNGDTAQITYSGTKSGPQKALVSAEMGYDIDFNIISNGKILYYLEYIEYDMGQYQSVIYRVNIATKVKKKICKVRTKNYDMVSLAGYYNKYLYYDVGSADSYGVYQYDLHIKKRKMVVKGANVALCYKRYLICSPNSGAPCELPIYVYDCKSGKKNTISKKAGGWEIVSNRIYYAEVAGGEWDGGSVVAWNIKCSDFSGKNKKTLVRKLEASYFGKISRSQVYYSKYYMNGEMEYYCYDVKTEKSKRIDEDEYRKRLGW